MMAKMSDQKDLLCRSLVEKDEEEVKKLVENSFRDFLNGKYWDWKYKLNPDFDASLVAVAEKDGKIVGCNHWLMRELKITPSIEIQAILGADIAVRPEYRGSGIGRSLLLFMRSSEAIKQNKAAISYMFADPGLTENLYKPVAGYIPAPDATVAYVKLLNWNELKKRASVLNWRMKVSKDKFRDLPKSDLTILIRLPNAPVLLLKLRRGRIKVSGADSGKANIRLESDLSTLAILKRRKHRVYNLLKMLLLRRLKIRGSIIDLFRFYRSLWILEEIFSQKVF
jgi:predicted N-acetyltransferase YhbS